VKLQIDTNAQMITYETDGEIKNFSLYSDEAFMVLSQLWLKVGWNQKYGYSFSWFGRPIIQLPEDMIRMQEVIYRVKPDVIIETGVAHGGSLIFYASLCKAMGRGRIVGIDIEIRPDNHTAIASHELASYISLIIGNSTDPEVIGQIQAMIQPDESILVILDSNHTKQHVANELVAYSPVVTPDSYIVATDGIMRDLYDVPRGDHNWKLDNPAVAAIEFAQSHPEFVLEQPAWPFNESTLRDNLTHWPSAWLRRLI
jgi:cephalosporin hydroxylase